MKAIIVDDEYYALEGLRMELEDIGGVEVIGTYESGSHLLSEIDQLSPDIIFLDIEMPEMNGFQVLDYLLQKGVEASIVFVTAYSQYAVKAFEINAVDYIVKPVARDRLIKTIDRLKMVKPPVTEEKLEINCFRHFSIMSCEREINSGWRTKKAEELIAFLICEKGKFVSKEKIADTLWPELDGVKGVSNLYLAFYYIKKQESSKGIKIPIESERGKMRINLNETICDLNIFDQMAEKAEYETEERLKILEKAVQLYQGALLEDCYYDWVVDYQQYYALKNEGFLQELIDHNKRIGNLEKADYYKSKSDQL